MLSRRLLRGVLIMAPFAHAVGGSSVALTVRTHVNTGPSDNMVSSLIIGSEAAMLIDMPIAIPQAQELVAWIKDTTDKPLVAAFTTHFHPDHFLSGTEVLKHFPGIQYYANPAAVGLIEEAAPHYVRVPESLEESLKGRCRVNASYRSQHSLLRSEQVV